jgi:Aspartyl protease/PDZ domain
MKQKILYTLVFLLAATTLQAQTEKAKRLTRFGFRQFSGGIVVLSATVDEHKDTLSFILDTGSSGISLDSGTVSYLKLPTEISDINIVGIAGTRVLSFVKNATLNLPGLSVPHLDFHIVDYEVLTETYGVKIDGIIGYSFLRQFIVNIDYDSLQIEVFTPGQYKYPRQGHILKPGFTKIPMIDARIKEDKKINTRYYFDIGAGLSLLLNQQFVTDSNFLRKKRKPVTAQVEGLGGKAQMQLTTIKELKVGPYVFRQVPTYIFEDVNNVLSYPTLAGLIGNDILRRFNTVINYPAKEIHLTPNSHYRELFDYSYSGLNIYFVDGKVMVGEVMKDSPAEKAGFKAGDVIFGIGNNFSNNIQKYKEMIQNVGQNLAIVVIRDEKAMLLMLKVKSIR